MESRSPLQNIIVADLTTPLPAGQLRADGAALEARLLHPLGVPSLLLRAAEAGPEVGIHFVGYGGVERFVAYAELAEIARRRAAALRDAGIARGDKLLFILRDSFETVASLWGALFAGIVPVPVVYPSSFKADSEGIQKLRSVYLKLGAPAVLTDSALVEKRDDIASLLGPDLRLLDVVEMARGERRLEPTQLQLDTTAFIQFSSGSTGDPKGVVLSHRNILLNLDAMTQGAKFNKDDVFLSWMPYHHDMGIFGFHLTPLSVPCPQVNLSPLQFVKTPGLWMTKVREHRATITGSPNFGYKYLLDKTTAEQRADWDLSSLQLIFNGAEPIAASVMDTFLQVLKPQGLRAQAMYPVYGMAEAVLGVSFPERGELPRVHVVSRRALASEGRAVRCSESDADAMYLVDLGHPIPGSALRITDDDDRPLEQGKVGHIQLSGDNVTRGYFQNERANAASFCGEWLRTGDVGLLIDGRLCVTGRAKDVIFVRGQNYFAYDIEQAAAELLGANLDNIAAAGWHDDAAGCERVALFIAQRSFPEDGVTLLRNVWSHIADSFGIPLDHIVVVAALPKTSSGKVRRYFLVEQFRASRLAGEAFTAEQLQPQHAPRAATLEHELDTPFEALVRSVWVAVLGDSARAASKQMSFRSLGGTSIKSLEVLAKLEQTYARSLPHELLVRAATIGDMAIQLEQLIGRNAEPERAAPPASGRAGVEDDEIVIVGADGVLPGALWLDQLWNTLLKNEASIRDVALSERSSLRAVAPGTYWAALSEDLYDFDPEFFRISEQEALVMDPQQRSFLQLSWRLLEGAGYDAARRDGAPIGVFVGASYNSYFEHQLTTLMKEAARDFECWSGHAELKNQFCDEWEMRHPETGSHPNTAADNLLNMVAARTAQHLNLKGPALAVDTACSSSLVAVHLACEALRRGECTMAIAGGVNVLATRSLFAIFERAGVLSRSGVCQPFSSEAHGFVPGEGVGAVLLKRRRDALRDGDQIWAVIRGSAINNDGTSLGVMAPNPDGQREVIARVYESAQIVPGSIQYVEAHATGTAVGDPSELRALAQVFSPGERPQAVALGSIKSNVGHLLAAAGIASLLKVLLALRHRTIPPTGTIANQLPQLKAADSPFEVPAEARPWQVPEGAPRRAAINSFGFGGTNCHLVLEEHVPVAPAPSSLPERADAALFCLSAPSQEGLLRRRDELVAALTRSPALGPQALARTEAEGRTQFAHRLAAWAASPAAAATALRDAKAGASSVATKPRVALICSGQGTQRPGSGAELYASDARFRAHFDQVIEVCSTALGQDLRRLLFERKEPELLAKTELTQPIVFSVSYALGRTLLDAGLDAFCAFGHSVGEYTAAALSGMLPPEAAARLVSARGLAMAKCPSGAMAAVFADAARVASLIAESGLSIWVAGHNITHTAVSGSAADIARFAALAERADIRARPLRVSHAFHSPMLRPFEGEFRRALGVERFSAATLPLISNVSGRWLDERGASEDYWIEHALSPVRFEQSVAFALAQGVTHFVEVGPSTALTGMVRKLIADQGAKALATLEPPRSERQTLFQTLGQLYVDCAIASPDRIELRSGTQRAPMSASPMNPRRIAPSARASHAAAGAPTPSALRAVPSQASAAPQNDLHHRWVWEPVGQRAVQDIARRAFVLAEDDELSAALARGLARVPGIAQIECHTALEGQALEDAVVIDLRFLCPPSHEAAAVERCAELLLTLKRLGAAQPAAQRTAYLLVTSGAFHCDTEPRSALSPAQAALQAMLASLAAEPGGARYRGLDVLPGLMSERLAGLVEGELRAAPASEPVVAARGNRVFARGLHAAELPAGVGFRAEAGQTFLITGGAGAVGRSIARALATQADVHVVLAGRSAAASDLPGVQTGLGFGYDTPHGKEVFDYEQVDVTDEAAVFDLLRRVHERYGRLDGIVHAAGLVDSERLLASEKTPDSIARVMSPKVLGSLNIVHALRRLQLAPQFVVLLGSVSASRSIWGQGLSDYAAANAFLAGLAERLGDEMAGTHWLTLNFALWAGLGMANTPGVQRSAEALGIPPILASAANAALAKALGGRDTVLHVFARESRRKSGPEVSLPRSKQHSAVLPSVGDVDRQIKAILARQLGRAIDAVDWDESFAQLGLESAMAVASANELHDLLGVEVPATTLFEHQSLRELAREIHRRLAAAGRGLQSASSAPSQVLLAPAAASAQREDIAVIGMACRLPGASSPSEYRSLLERGEVKIGPVNQQRFAHPGFYSADKSNATSYSRWGGFLDNPYLFDARYFGISPREAADMDPQQRLFLEACAEALQDSGYGELETRDVGVFVGCEANHYAEQYLAGAQYALIQKELAQLNGFRGLSDGERSACLEAIERVLAPADLNSDAVAGNGLNEIAARVSHCFDLVGPSLTVNTACSSTLVAVHLASEALRRGEAELALVGGVYLATTPTGLLMLSQMQALSPDGTSAPFDARANGMVLGEGATALLLKPLSAALRDGDKVQAVIKGSAINNDGWSRGITVPNPAGQAAAARSAYERYQIEPGSIGYVEAHGTATPVGDPVELDGLRRVFEGSEQGSIGIGSVKGQIGHMLAAAGGASLMKAILSVRDGKMFPTVGYEKPNPLLKLEQSPFFVVQGETKPWRVEGPRRAGVNAFGFGGTNCHIIVEQPPAHVVAAPAKSGSGLLLLSAHTETAQRTFVERVRERLLSAADADVDDLVYSVNRGQRQGAFRQACVYRDADELRALLAAGFASPSLPAMTKVKQGRPPRWTWEWRDDVATAAFVERLVAVVPQLRTRQETWQESCGTVFDDAFQVRQTANLCMLGELLAELGVTPEEVCVDSDLSRQATILLSSHQTAFGRKGGRWSVARILEDKHMVRQGDALLTIKARRAATAGAEEAPALVLRDRGDAKHALLDALAVAFRQGARISPEALCAGAARLVDAPVCPLEPTQHLAPRRVAAQAALAVAAEPSHSSSEILFSSLADSRSRRIAEALRRSFPAE